MRGPAPPALTAVPSTAREQPVISASASVASVERFTRAFQPEAGRSVTIDVSPAHFWDISGVGALDKIVARLRRDGSEVKVIGYNKASADLVTGE